MKLKTSCLYCTVYLLSNIVNAQLPHTLTQVARNVHYGSAYGVAALNDSTIMLANGSGGLRAYNYDGTSFTLNAVADDGGEALDVTIGPDGLIYLANGKDGLRIYRYHGNSFICIAHACEGGDQGKAQSVTLSLDGAIFLANYLG